MIVNFVITVIGRKKRYGQVLQSSHPIARPLLPRVYCIYIISLFI